MTAIATREDKLGSVVKFEENTDHGYCRATATVTLTPTSEIGDVLYDNTGKLVLVDAANTANIEAILIDTNVYKKRPVSGTADAELAVLVRGSAIVAKQSLNFNADINTDAEKLALYDALEALGILVKEQV